MKIFHWLIVCDICQVVFDPEEADLDGELTCPNCGESGFICDDDDHADEPDLDDLEPPPGAHPDWPENLNAKELYTAWAIRKLLPLHLQEMLRAEYDSRDEKLPNDDGLA